MKKLNLTHLREDIQNFVLTATDEQRRYAAQKPVWHPYKTASEILNKLEDLFNYPKRNRMRGVFIIGDPNSGKSEILSKFCSKHEAYVDEDTGKLIVPVLMIQSPPVCNEKKLYLAIIDKLNASRKNREDVDLLRPRIIDLFKELEVKVFVVDEIHNFLSGRGKKQRDAMTALRYLANELKIPIVAAGKDDAHTVLMTDSQLTSRFKIKKIPRWENNEEYEKLMNSFVTILPLKKESMLVEPGIASKILHLSEGLIGGIAEILEESTRLAIESGVEEITLDIINNIDYDPPGDKNKWK